MRRTVRLIGVAGLLAAVVLSGGCGGAIVGEWEMVRCVPNRDVFCVDEANFGRDGTYQATVTIEGREARQAGSYVYNGFQLTLRPNAGGQRRFNTVLRMNRLEILHGEARAILRKAGK